MNVRWLQGLGLEEQNKRHGCLAVWDEMPFDTAKHLKEFRESLMKTIRDWAKKQDCLEITDEKELRGES